MKDRLLNIMLVTLGLMLVLNFVLPGANKVPEAPSGVVSVEVASKEYTVPAIPEVHFNNTTNHSVTFNTCKELSVLKDYRSITLDASVAAFCKDITIEPNTKSTLDLSALAAMFRIPWEYAFKLTLPGLPEQAAHYTQADRGVIREFFSAVFFRPVLNLFVFLIEYLPGHSLGFAIIAITILIRIVLLWPQHQMLVSSRRMQTIQPKIKELQEKYKGNQAEIGMKLMELYKKEGVNPLGSCLPLLIQMPILIVLYGVISNISDPSNTYHIYSFLSGFDVKSIATTFYGLDLKGVGGVPGAVLAFLVGILTWVQIKLSLLRNPMDTSAPKVLEKQSDGSLTSEMPSIDPAMMNRFMLWGMPIIITISTYSFPAGLGVYWLIGTLFVLVQQYIANIVSDNKKAA